ncbi:MAG TPA: enoyl-CoA hydratase [Bryobacteraceae bacterium]|jgi:2-(1,2-epoxy-1,2-dihydrophenyl)acetyl-CoA isomerase|nr:enoyl-CoA hydratase [Bryobacteraceae bacterium]
MPDLLTEVRDRVATLTLNRPDKLNALNGEIIRGSIATLKDWARDPNVGAIVVTGTGRAFCAGGDVSKFLEGGKDDRSLEQRVDELRDSQDLSWQLYNNGKVTIAAVNGFAMGAGLGIALACDLRIASAEAKFGTAYAKVGFGGDFGTTWLLARYVGAPKAKEMFFLGDAMDAAEAQRIGLVNRVVASDQLAASVSEIAARIAHGPLTSFRYMKANVNFAQSTDFRTLMDREAETHLRCGMTDDHREGVQAFLEKRAAVFKGR